MESATPLPCANTLPAPVAGLPMPTELARCLRRIAGQEQLRGNPFGGIIEQGGVFQAQAHRRQRLGDEVVVHQRPAVVIHHVTARAVGPGFVVVPGHEAPAQRRAFAAQGVHRIAQALGAQELPRWDQLLQARQRAEQALGDFLVQPVLLEHSAPEDILADEHRVVVVGRAATGRREGWCAARPPGWRESACRIR